MPSILIADDDLRLCELLKTVLTEEQYQVHIAHDGQQALDILSEIGIDLLLLDVMMPKLNGLQTARQVCKRFSTPMLMLTAMDDEATKIEGFEAGADQYLPKPFSVPELLIRIKSMLRRVSLEQTRHARIASGDVLEMSICSLPFTNTESELINYLMQRKGQPVSKKELQVKVLRREFCEFDRNLDMHISNMRRKLVQSGFSKNIIMTVRNKGYTFDHQTQ